MTYLWDDEKTVLITFSSKSVSQKGGKVLEKAWKSIQKNYGKTPQKIKNGCYVKLDKFGLIKTVSLCYIMRIANFSFINTAFIF